MDKIRKFVHDLYYLPLKILNKLNIKTHPAHWVNQEPPYFVVSNRTIVIFIALFAMLAFELLEIILT